MSDSEVTIRIPGGVPLLPAERPRHAGALDGTLASQSLTPASLWQRFFSFPALLGALLVGAVATIARTFFVDPDVWWHIKQGQFILATRHVPTQDIYSLTLSGKSWFAYEWLGDVLLATMYRLGGMRGLDVLLIVLGGAILIGLYTLAAIRSGNSKAAFVATAAVFVLAAVSFNLRPQMMGYLFLVLTFIILERFRMGKRQGVWALPILMLVWVNAHGSWIIGLGVVGVYLAGSLLEFHIGDIEAHRWSYSDRLRLSVVLALCAGATLVTPYGTKLARYPFDVAFSLPLGVANVIEWQPMPFNLVVGKMFLVLLLGFAVLQIAYRFTWRLDEFGLFLFSAAVACVHRRFLLIFVPVFVPMLATVLARWVPRYERGKDRSSFNAILMTVILAIIVWYFPSQADLRRRVGITYPVDAVEYLNSHDVPGPMYNTYGFGGYLILTRGPEHKVFMDGRSELYERAGFLPDYYKISGINPGALSVLQKYGIQSCLLNHDEALATLLAALPDWQKVYEDPTSVLFVKRNDPPALQQSGTAGILGWGLETPFCSRKRRQARHFANFLRSAAQLDSEKRGRTVMGRQLMSGARAPEARDAMDPGETRPVLSVVVPCCNEEAVLRESNCHFIAGAEYFARYKERYFGLQIVRRDYIVFFPRPLAWLRPLEPRLSWCPAGAQSALAARRAAHV